MSDTRTSSDDLLGLTADIVSAMVGNNIIASDELPALIENTYAALAKTLTPAEPESAKAQPAVPIRSSVKHDYIVCLEDGAKLKMLKRYLMTNYAMTPDDYRAKWGLPRDYPMVSPDYAEQRRALAKATGLGRKAAEQVLAEPAAIIPAKVRKTRSTKAAAEPEANAIAEAPKKRGRPTKVKPDPLQQSRKKAPKDHDAEVVREPHED